MTNTQLIDWLNAQSKVAGTTNYVAAATGADVNFRPTSNSPVVNTGAILSAGYKYDLMGVDQSWMGASWEIGAYALVPPSTYLVVVH
jgi:hypothetical protein